MEYVKWSNDDKVATITIERPPANALSTGLLKKLSAILDEIELTNEIRVILIHGEGRFFSAGADIKEFTKVASGDEFSNLSKLGQHLFERIEAFPKPIIAAIHGAAFGGGLELAMACHIRLVAEDAKLGLPELQLGMIPGFAGTQRLPRLIGRARALELMLTSEHITGIEAVQYGLANHSYPQDVLLENAYKIAKKIGKKSPQSMQAVIELLNLSKTNDYRDCLNREAELFGKVFVSKDGQEGISAFIEKREPYFTGE